MLDFSEWTQRASTFLRQLTNLPGKIDIYSAIQPPITSEFSREWIESNDCLLPAEVKQFLSAASGRCTFSYKWEPPQTLHQVLDNMLGGNHHVLYGGGDLCQADKYHVYAMQRDRDGQDILSWLPQQSTTNVMAAEEHHGRLPLLELEDKAAISLQVQTVFGPHPIVYVENIGEPPEHVISPSFEQFLLDWEKVCYLNPSIEVLQPWLDPVTGQLHPDPDKAQALRRLMLATSNCQKQE